MAANDSFNYLAVLFSIIIGLAATEMLQGLRALLVARHRTQLYWPALLRAAMLLLVLAQTWWATFGLRTEAVWTFAMYAAVLLHITLLYLVVALALPIPAETGPVNMRALYFAHSRPAYALLIATGLASIAKDVAIDSSLPEATNVAFHAVFIGLGLLAAVSRRDRVHQFVTLALFGLFVAYIVLLFDRLPG